VHRMSGHAALEQWQGWDQRDFLLRHQPVAGRGTSTAASYGDLRLGGRSRLVPRLEQARRYFESV